MTVCHCVFLLPCLSAFLPKSHYLSVWLAVNRLAVPPGWLNRFTPYLPHTQWQPQPRETWVMVLSDVHPDSIELDGRHTPEITKGGDGKSGGWVRKGEGRSQAIDKAGTHCLIKIYSSTPPTSPAIRLGRAGGWKGRMWLVDFFSPSALIACASMALCLPKWICVFLPFVCWWQASVSLPKSEWG